MNVKQYKLTAMILLVCSLLGMGAISFAAQDPAGLAYEEYGVWFDQKTGMVTGMVTGVTKLEIPKEIDGKTVQAIGDKAFYESSTLTSVSLPESIVNIGKQAFAGCGELETVLFSKGLKSIGTEAFLQCKKLKSVSFPDSLERIGDSAFMGCSLLEQIVISEGMTFIGDGAFSYCDKLAGFEVAKESNYYSSEGGVLLNQAKTKLIQYPAGLQKTTYVVPETITEIGNGGFAYCPSLTTITLPETLQIIGEFAFFECDRLTELRVPDQVTFIGKEAFAWCDGLTKVELPKDLKTIEYGLFWYSTHLKEVTLPQTITKISDYAFARCEQLTELPLPEGVTSLGEESFAYCTALQSMELPKAVQQIGKRAFYECKELKQVVIYNGETELGDQLFEGCPPIQFYTPEFTSAQQFVLNRGDAWEKVVTVTYQGKKISFDQRPVTRYDRTLVPVRAIFEAMGATVSWDETTQTVTTSRNGITLSLQIGNQTMTKNGEGIILDVPALKINDRTMVPVRAVADGLDCIVSWEETTQTVSIWEKEN